MADASDVEGEINLTWEPVKGALYYIIQASNSGRNWKEVDVSGKPALSVSNLKSGKIYSFRVSAVCSAGQGEWSSKVVKKSP
jgi:hypothetical protein